MHFIPVRSISQLHRIILTTTIQSLTLAALANRRLQNLDSGKSTVLRAIFISGFLKEEAICFTITALIISGNITDDDVNPAVIIESSST